MKRVRQMSDLRGFSRLAVEATVAMTDLVEEVHRSVTTLPERGPVEPSRRKRMRGITGFVYRTIRNITHWVGHSVDGGLAQLQPLLLPPPAAPSSTPAAAAPVSPHRDAVLAALNGVLGDHLDATHNPLAIPMRFRRSGREIDPAQERGARMLFMVHGLCRSDLQWLRKGHDHGVSLAADLCLTPVYLHYNSGRAIATNGRELAMRLEALVADWGEPLGEIVVVAHSMGGLVMRSACQIAEADGLAWRDKLRRIVFLGTPHHGAPFERGGNWVTLALDKSSYTAAFARLGRIRSAGITDLRFGQVLPLREGDRFAPGRGLGEVLPLPSGVACYAIAATLAKGPEPAPASGVLAAAKSVLGDGLVPLASALGDDADPARALAIPAKRRFVAFGMSHLDLLNRSEVYEQIRAWLTEPAAAPEPRDSVSREAAGVRTPASLPVG
ncbi:MAG: alpha/beta hydrolase [Thermoanaerobaculia bacterium]